MPHIQVLDKHTAELIAAGEVVERPSSVIKELVENAIDAGATTVTVEIKQGGIASLSIADNGCGIPHDEVPTAFLRHATSKIRSEEDLDAIGTLGFRGEALASVAAVSRVELVTCTADETAGTRYCLEGGDPVLFEDIGCPVGTTIVVRDIFYNVPARMKFLKKDVTEANAAAGVVDRLALSHPEISFRFIRDGREELLTPGDGRLYSCIYSVFGKEFAGGLMPVDYTLGGVHVHGFVSKPASPRANRSMQHFFINGRYVKTRTAMAALEQAFKGSLMVGKFPACVLNIDLPAALVDANVHPAKIEVRFVNEKPVFDSVYHAVKSALQTQDTPRQGVLPEPKIPTAAPSPSVTGEQLHMPMSPAPRAAVRETAVSPLPEIAAEPARLSAVDMIQPATPAVERTEPLFHERAGGGIPLRAPHPGPDIARTTPPVEVIPADAFLAGKPAGGAMPEKSGTEPLVSLSAEEEPVIRVIGEAFKTYILAEMGDSFFLIDKHAAHERILYNELQKNARADAQILLQPITVSPGREASSALLEHSDLLAQAGFETEDFGGGALLVRTVPMMLSGEDVPLLLEEIAKGFLNGGQTVQTDKLDWIYHSTACRAAVKAGDKSRPEDLEALARRVLLRDDVRYCPHGRPVCVEMSRRDFEKQFGRIV